MDFLNRAFVDERERWYRVAIMIDQSQDELIQWLLEGDSAIRWQVQRDLLSAPPATWEVERAKVASTGWGARLLSERGTDGRWAEGLYSPKYTSTTYTLILLRRLGLPRDHREAIASLELLLDEQVWVFGRRNTWESCVAGMTLALASWFQIETARRTPLLSYLLDEQMTDGGWNCRRHRGATHSSFHTTMNVLEGLREHVAAGGTREDDVHSAEVRAQRFLCEHKLYRSHRTGEVVDPRMARLPFPPTWRHDILRALDYFRDADAERDNRLTDPIAVIEGKRRHDGRWPLQKGYTGKRWFGMERVGQPSRWNTLRALRVLRWWRDAE